jgi:hypothetical protein
MIHPQHPAALCLLVALLLPALPALAQQRLLDVDTTQGLGKMFYSVFQRYDQLRFSGYIQVQYQKAETTGIESFAGGDFALKSDNRFMLRRGRFRMDYAGFNEAHDPTVFFVFQFDGTERGVVIRDFWGRIFENYWKVFSVTTGMFARPMGFELSLSSSDRESPERGRMSQILMPTERDLGAMVTYDMKLPSSKTSLLRFDVGVFNGQGLAGTTDFDSYKDVIGRIAMMPIRFAGESRITGSVSYLHGGVIQTNPVVYTTGSDGSGHKALLPDSSAANIDAMAPRRYVDIDAQVRFVYDWGSTELRGELLWGAQPGALTTTRSGGTLPLTPTVRRNFRGGYFWFLQNFGPPRHQVILKYDWYDPNVAVAGAEIGRPGSLLGPAEIAYSTVGVGYVWYANPNMKLACYYDRVTNESTLLERYAEDLPDNVLTFRIQYRF